jgi:hypothetical protein
VPHLLLVTLGDLDVAIAEVDANVSMDADSDCVLALHHQLLRRVPRSVVGRGCVARYALSWPRRWIRREVLLRILLPHETTRQRGDERA